jgi:hypothetical protein
MANFQAPVIATQLPLDGAAGRLRGSLATTTGERGRLFEIRTRKYQIVPRFEGRNEVRKLYSPLHLRVVFPPPRGRGAKILAVPGQMKEFRSLERSDGGCLRPGERIRHNAAFKAAAGGLCCVSCFSAAASGWTISQSSLERAKRTNEADGRQVAGFA